MVLNLLTQLSLSKTYYKKRFRKCSRNWNMYNFHVQLSWELTYENRANSKNYRNKLLHEVQPQTLLRAEAIARSESAFAYARSSRCAGYNDRTDVTWVMTFFYSITRRKQLKVYYQFMTLNFDELKTDTLKFENIFIL